MKGFGIVLIVLQAISILGSVMSNEYLNMYLNLVSARGICNFIGFHLIGVLGIILLLTGIKKNKKKELDSGEPN